MRIYDLIQTGRKYNFLLPVPIRDLINKKIQKIVFNKAIREFSAKDTELELNDQLINRLIFGWGNQGFSAKIGYIKAVIKYTSSSEGPILECGSGLSTILAGILAQKRGIRVYSLEHNAFWYKKVNRALTKFKISSVKLFIDQLKNYDGFDWYNLPEETLPDNFSLVICDGPPGSTLGGRYGLIPIMKYRLVKSIILLDDISRLGEQDIVRKWGNEVNLSINHPEENESYIVLEIS